MLSVADRKKKAIRILKKLRTATQGMTEPASSTIVKRFGRDPFLVLASCILSLRTRDSVSLPASLRLFKHAKTPKQLLKVPISKIQKIIYPVGFYRVKSKNLHKISKILLEKYGGQVPSTKEELMALPGVGLKTTNLVQADGFGIPAIVVDTHVHRLANLMKLVKTKTPEKTEEELKKIVPKKDWIEFSRLVVTWGQNNRGPVPLD